MERLEGSTTPSEHSTRSGKGGNALSSSQGIPALPSTPSQHLLPLSLLSPATSSVRGVVLPGRNLHVLYRPVFFGLSFPYGASDQDLISAILLLPTVTILFPSPAAGKTNQPVFGFCDQSACIVYVERKVSCFSGCCVFI